MPAGCGYGELKDFKSTLGGHNIVDMKRMERRKCMLQTPENHKRAPLPKVFQN